MQNSGESYGQTLPDQVDRIANLFDAHLGLLVDVRELYRDRAAVEREYAAKLQVLARKATDKKNKIASLLVVGDSPTKVYDEATLRQSTLDNAYNEIISSVSNASQDHINLADAITAHITESLKTVERQNEEGKKKPVYLISTAVANKMKAKFYTEDLPGLEDDLQTRLVTKFVGILLQAQTIQIMHHDTLKDRFASVESALKAIDAGKDQDLFADHNIRPFTVPNDLRFEPCSSHYDTADMNVEPAPKIFLQNKLARSRNKLQELEPVLQAKRNNLNAVQSIFFADGDSNGLGDEVEKYGNFAAGYSSNDDSVNNDEVLSNYLEAKQQLVFYSNSACILNTEIETISAALGDDEGGQSPHAFKSSSFSIPTTCGYCKVR
ncbi:hypothetical protein SERLADRAFT_370507 [Serpula lacrymans var. lacrymans S7.9]|uniref:FCH domain-containing protein n=1 Tax=Serpula lacrymans var. lacrymans (strain S7.9) TaxID=578457 RepID=F8NYH5_SERL9|nr:uncharacterized protein SERLADRAFT_370507 [Serpula lacrymans var. lacrymans S7.9]EGO23646.1 hypothetical protein SERLADRAFT_370507 [Serpula lacrymans var. lacrymans S7.9]